MQQKKPYKSLIISAIVIGGIGAIFEVIGALFKIMHWPGASISLIFAAIMIVTALVFLIVWGVLRAK